MKPRIVIKEADGVVASKELDVEPLNAIVQKHNLQWWPGTDKAIKEIRKAGIVSEDRLNQLEYDEPEDIVCDYLMIARLDPIEEAPCIAAIGCEILREENT